jgi:hypothetical protein
MGLGKIDDWLMQEEAMRERNIPVFLRIRVVVGLHGSVLKFHAHASPSVP